MLTIEQFREIDSGLAGQTDEEIIELRESLYILARLALSQYHKRSCSNSDQEVDCQAGENSGTMAI
jgi:hypothetical protein